MQLSPSLFMASCAPVVLQLFQSAPDPDNENNYVEPNCPHGNMAC